MSHDRGSNLTEPIENPYGLPDGWVAVPLSLIQRAKDMTMDICNSHTGHCPEEIYCPQIYASTARELKDALRNVLEEHKPNPTGQPRTASVRSVAPGCSNSEVQK